MSERIIVYEDYIEFENNDPSERELAKSLGPMVTDNMGNRRRVRTGDVVDGDEIKLMGGFRGELKKHVKAELPQAVEADLMAFLGRAYQFNFQNKNDLRIKLAKRLQRDAWRDLKIKLLEYVRKDKMRPLAALHTLLAETDAFEAAAPAQALSPEELEKLGLM